MKTIGQIIEEWELEAKTAYNTQQPYHLCTIWGVEFECEDVEFEVIN